MVRTLRRAIIYQAFSFHGLWNGGDSMGYELEMEEIREENYRRNKLKKSDTRRSKEEIENMIFTFGLV